MHNTRPDTVDIGDGARASARQYHLDTRTFPFNRLQHVLVHDKAYHWHLAHGASMAFTAPHALQLLLQKKRPEKETKMKPHTADQNDNDQHS